MSRIIVDRNWCSTNAFSGSPSRSTRSASHAETRLTSVAPTLPMTRPGTCRGPIRHSGSSARPTHGSASAHAQRLATVRKSARPGWMSSTTRAPLRCAASMYVRTLSAAMSWLKSPSGPAIGSATVTISSYTVWIRSPSSRNGWAARRSRRCISSGAVSPSTPSDPVPAVP